MVGQHPGWPGSSLDVVLLLTADDEVLIERLTTRGRSDDTPDVIERRLAIYHQETAPLLPTTADWSSRSTELDPSTTSTTGSGTALAGHQVGSPRPESAAPEMSAATRTTERTSMPSTSPGYSITIRAEAPPAIGATAELAAAVLAAGGSLTALDVVESGPAAIVVDVSCDAIDAEHADTVTQSIGNLQGCTSGKCPTAPSCCISAGKLKWSPRFRSKHRDDLSRSCFATCSQSHSSWPSVGAFCTLSVLFAPLDSRLGAP